MPMLIREALESHTTVHVGVLKTYKRLSRDLFWDRMKHDVISMLHDAQFANDRSIQL